MVEDEDEDDAKHAYLILACDGVRQPTHPHQSARACVESLLTLGDGGGKVWDVLSDEESAAIAMKERNALTAAVRIREHSYYLGSGDDICAVVVRLL